MALETDGVDLLIRFSVLVDRLDASHPHHGCVQPFVFRRQTTCRVKLSATAPRIQNQKYSLRQSIAVTPMAVTHLST